jgi:hypothetical protein
MPARGCEEMKAIPPNFIVKLNAGKFANFLDNFGV